MRDLIKNGTRYGRAFAPHGTRVYADDSIKPNLRGPPLPVPRTSSNVEPVLSAAGVVIVVLAREHEPKEPRAVVPYKEHGPVFAFTRILLKRHPSPHDFARIRCAIRFRRVHEGDLALKIARIPARRPGWLALPRWRFLQRTGVDREHQDGRDAEPDLPPFHAVDTIARERVGR